MNILCFFGSCTSSPTKVWTLKFCLLKSKPLMQTRKEEHYGYMVTSQQCRFAFNAMLISHSTWLSVHSKQSFCFIVAPQLVFWLPPNPPTRRFQPTTAVPKENKLTAHASNVLLLWYVAHHLSPVSVLAYLFGAFCSRVAWTEMFRTMRAASTGGESILWEMNGMEPTCSNF